jgi:predicted enzyme related to lactoylglutathione lyase
MPEISEHAPGTPSWVDLASPDPDASARFYGGLFGWTAPDPGPVEETGGYRMLQRDGRDVAGLGPTQAPDQPAMWTTYVSTDDADAVTAKVQEAGGRVLMEPLDVLGAGRMAVFADAGGAVISVWQPQSHSGAAVVNEPGSLCWNELATRDIEEAKRFYAAVFGWSADTNASGDTSYTEWKLGDRTVGGMIQMNDEWPAEVPAHWMVYFAVEDIDAATRKVEELGGRISVPPTDTPAGRFSVVNDLHGAVFSIIRLAEGRGEERREEANGEVAAAASADDETKPETRAGGEEPGDEDESAPAAESGPAGESGAPEEDARGDEDSGGDGRR